MSSYPPYPAAPGHNRVAPEDPQTSRKMAGWALGLCCVPCLLTLIAGVALAIKVLGRGRDGQDHGRTMAIVALCVAGLWLVVGVGGWAVSQALKPDRDGDGSLAEASDVSGEQLRVGDCLDLPAEGEVESVSAVPCSEPHEAEVYAAFELPAGRYPGDAEVVRLAEDGCIDRFFGYVGIAPPDSKLVTFLIYPAEDSWAQSRGVRCLADEPGDKQVTGSVNGAKR